MINSKYDVFISYSRIDYKDSNNEPIPNNVISKITSAFKKNHISYWIDENGIYTGDNFAPKIAEAIKNSSVFVFVSTENSNSSQWAQNEVCVAQQYKKPILPIKCDDSTYATSVVMYLAMLDYCDYKNFSDKAILQLVDAVKEKLPHNVDPNHNIRSRNDENYKEAIVTTLSEINHQFVDISQIAVSQVLEASERTRESIGEFYRLFNKKSEEQLNEFQQFQNDIHSHLSHIENSSKENTSEICHRLEDLIKISEETKSFLEKMCCLLKSQSINETISNNFISNIIFVIDVSGSMKGEKIHILNTIMNRMTSRFEELFSVNPDITFRLSVLYYSSSAEWMYDHAKDICEFKWLELKASGLTNLGEALDKLNSKLSFENGILSDVDNTLPPLIIFMSDGAPTDSFDNSISLIRKNQIYEMAHKRVIAIGDDADIETFSHLSFQGVIKTRGDFDMEYAISDVISGYINEISTTKMTLKYNY